MLWKDSVKLDVHGAMIFAALRVERAMSKYGVDTWITSANDGNHMLGSKHYEGKALDFRIHHVNVPAREPMVKEIKTALGPWFTVLWEDPNTANEHLHVQFNG